MTSFGAGVFRQEILPYPMLPPYRFNFSFRRCPGRHDGARMARGYVQNGFETGRSHRAQSPNQIL